MSSIHKYVVTFKSEIMTPDGPTWYLENVNHIETNESCTICTDTYNIIVDKDFIIAIIYKSKYTSRN